EGGRVSAVPHEATLTRPFAVPAGVRRLAIQIATGVVLLLLWELFVRWLAPGFVARPTTVARAIPEVLAQRNVPAGTPRFWGSAEATVISAFEGLVIGLSAGAIVGLTMGR